MRVFNSFNKKIKFREKDYIHKNYIREDDKAVIPIRLDNIDELYMKHDYKRLVLSDEISDYIEEVASIIPFKHDIILEIHCKRIDDESQKRIRKVIKNNYGMEIDDIDYETRMSKYISAISLVLGIAIIVLALAIEVEKIGIIKELLMLAGWVIVWDILEELIFTNSRRKMERLNKLQIYESQVDFVFDDME